MSNNWVEVCIQEHLDAGELLSRLNDAAVQGAWEADGGVHLYWPEDQWKEEKLASIRVVLSALVSASDKITLSVTRVPAQDWNEAWARSVKPLHIGRVVIRPSWEPAELNPHDIEIILDPKQAFGTGHHATTRMLLMWLQNDIRSGEAVLDVGTGSAILAMTAVKLGAASAIGIEIDPIAVDCAREAVAQNDLTSRIEIVCGTLADVPQERMTSANLVLANLDRQTVLSLAEELANCALRGARIMVSGILVEQEAEIGERFSGLDLILIDRREEEGWVALKFVRLESCDGDV